MACRNGSKVTKAVEFTLDLLGAFATMEEPMRHVIRRASEGHGVMSRKGNPTMKSWTIVCLVICMSIAVGACTGGGASSSEPAPTDSAARVTPEPGSSTDAAPATPEPASADTGASSTEPAAAPAPDTTASNGLVGTTWKLGPFMAHFKDATTVHVSGGELAEQMPDGIDAVYAVKDGAIEVTVLNGIVKKGTWNGSNLVIDGMVGEKQP